MQDEVQFVVVGKESKHLVLQVIRFLIPVERQGNKSLEPLVVVEKVKSY